ncbi:MAG TPA: FkbM family methyltransferase [Gammaproteobacteria bacterium]|nr:FkbM family methyltransferase [Gammaproteobacteria bacterium]
MAASRSASLRWQAVAARLKRVPLLRRGYARFFDRERYPYFALGRWARAGRALRQTTGIHGIKVDAGGVWVCLPNGLELAYLSEIPGAGLEPRLYRGQYEPLTTKLLGDALAEGGTLLDVGANIGWFSLHGALACDRVTVHAFEPGALVGRYLADNVRRNGFASRITLVPCAVSDHNGHAYITDHAIGHAMNHLVDRAAGAVRRIATLTLDDYACRNRLADIRLIKCDVEGAERAVLQGASRLLQTQRPALIIEVSPLWCARFGYRPADLWQLLQAHGYHYEVIGDSGLKASSGDFESDVGTGANVYFKPES